MMVLVFLMFITGQVKGEVPSYKLELDKHQIVNYSYLLLDKNNKNTFEDISNFSQSKWRNEHLTNSDLLILPGENWFSFKIINNTSEDKTVYLEVANQVRMSSVELFVRDRYQKINKKKMQLQRSNSRSAKVTVSPHSQATLYLTISSLNQLRSSVMLYSAKAYNEANGLLQFQQGISIGGLFCLSLAFLLLFFATSNKLIFILSGYFFSNTLMLSAMLGLNLNYLLPHLPELIGIELPLLTSLSSIFLLIFTSELFNLKVRFVNLYQVIRVYFLGLLIYMPLSIQLSVAENVSISLFIYAFVILSLIAFGLYLHKKSSRLALLFTLVMTIQFAFVLVVVGSINWFDIGFFSYRGAFYGVLFWINCLLVTLILSRQYRYHLKDKQEAQRQALTSAIASEKAQEELLILQSQSQEELENRVQERTLELNIALQELEEVNRELEQKNTLDELTGLFNRRFYDQKILAEFRRSKRNLTPLSLVLIDIDYFKSVNDTYGHLTGDRCLEWISAHIKQSLKRSSDLAFRYGGEEFCLILPDTDEKGAMALAEELRTRVAKQAFTYEETSIPLTISNGVFTYLQQDNVMTEQIFANADKALYQAKHDGRNQTKVCFE